MSRATQLVKKTCVFCGATAVVVTGVGTLATLIWVYLIQSG